MKADKIKRKVRQPWKKRINNKIIISDEPAKYVNPQDIVVRYEDILPTNEQGFDDYTRLQLIKEDKAHEGNLQITRKLMKESIIARLNSEALNKTIKVQDIEKYFKTIPKRVVDGETIYRLMKGLYPYRSTKNGAFRESDYLGVDLEEYAEIYETANNFSELPEFDMAKVKQAIQDPNIDAKTSKFLNEVHSLYELGGRNSKLSANKRLWEKEMEKEFERKQHEAILASHYLRLKDYYKDRHYEKYAERLMNRKAASVELSLLRNQNKTSGNDRNYCPPNNSQKRNENERIDFSDSIKMAWAEKLMDINYPAPPPFVITDQTEEALPGLRDKMNALKFNPKPLLTFEEEFEAAKLRTLSKQQSQVPGFYNIRKDYQKSKYCSTMLEITRRKQRKLTSWLYLLRT